MFREMVNKVLYWLQVVHSTCCNLVFLFLSWHRVILLDQLGLVLSSGICLNFLYEVPSREMQWTPILDVPECIETEP